MWRALTLIIEEIPVYKRCHFVITSYAFSWWSWCKNVAYV